jgi:hypothetical protein
VIAQLVEQWTENPCVAGSTPARTTKKGKLSSSSVFPFLFSAKPASGVQINQMRYLFFEVQ